MTLLSWDNDKKEILDRLRSRCAVKICAKTLNEVQFTEGWIEHHLKIFGPEGVMIADNGSTDEQVLKIYDRWKNDVLIFQFGGPHNQLHCHPRFKELFDAIAETSVRFAFIDIDERLVRISSDSWSADPTVAETIAQAPAECIVPTAWLVNKMRSMNSFYIRDQKGALGVVENLRMGKPFFPGQLVGRHCEIHNFQYHNRLEFDASAGQDLFLLHFTQFPERRIMTNRNKLISRGIVSQDMSNEEILAMSLEKFSDQTFLPLIDEIRWMKALIDDGSASVDESDMIRLMDDGTLFFSDAKARSVFQDRRNDFPAFFQRAMTGT
ncbi:hypothetical protein JQ604_00955 [Bradyrhizobium jicamae]|uniref:hypothetical protein n=1 Tax=Bradyrhizobium jicamae TaxID=280332 RepID=UPI001BA52DD9|nr:hypothetical protein [Bradyrhizobium jicamae]MBR0750747.1 hypothetical protein [Bradyrhizobium jicamae]